MSKSPRTFLRVDKEYPSIAKIKNIRDGVTHNWSGNMTLLFTVMLDRYTFFKAQGKEYYDNQESLAYRLGIHRSALKRQLAILYSLGLVEKTKKKVANGKVSNSYVVREIYDNMELVCYDAHGEEMQKQGGMPKAVLPPPVTESVEEEAYPY